MGREIHMRLAHFLAFVLFFAAAFAWPTWRTWEWTCSAQPVQSSRSASQNPCDRPNTCSRRSG